MPLRITTERLTLRRIAEHDVQDVLECVAHPSFARATPEIEATEAGVRRYIAAQNDLQPFEQGQCFDLAVERRADGKVIGLLSLVREEHGQAALGFALAVDHRGQGYATEAVRGLMGHGFGRLGLHRVHADTHSDNPGAWRVMERVGMRREGCLREATLRDGNWVNVVVYGLLATEWTAIDVDELTELRPERKP